MEDHSNIHYFLAADVGGTNARFRLVKRSTTDPKYRSVVLEKKTYKAADYSKIDEIFMNIMGSVNAKIKVCTLAIAGPKDGNKVQVTNIPEWGWVDVDELKATFGFEHCFLLNDFEANGYGASSVEVQDNPDCIVLNEGIPNPTGNKIILGPGTGLGCAIITYNKAEKYYNVHPGEGGHTEYTVLDEVDLRLKKFSFQYFKDHEGLDLSRISVERLTAGPALPLIYEFFKTEHPDLEVVCATNPETNEPSGKDILTNAVTNGDPLCLKTIDQFIKHLAILTGDLALFTLSYGGIYLCGGVAVALKEYLQREDCIFFKTYCNKGRFSERLANMPIYLLTHEPGLDGAEQYGLQALINNYDEQ